MAGRFEALSTKLYRAIKSRYPSWGEPPKQPAERIFEQGHRRLLADLARYCARSYKWTSTTFATEMAEESITSFTMFRRQSGGLSWRPGGLFWMPISYVALLFSFAFVLSLLLAAGPVSWSDWHEGRNGMLQIPGLALEYIRQFVVWAGSWILAFLILLSSAIIAFFSMLGRWLPVGIVSTFTDSSVVLGIGVAWLLDYVVSPVMFWFPPAFDEWLRGLTEDWLRFLLYELRAIFGLALFFGSLVGIIVLLFPRLASGRAFGLVAPDGKSATIIFCGSTFVDNFTINACVWLYRKPIRHRGFHRAWSHIKPEIEQWLATVVPKDAEIFLSGHSLGGAIAEIAAFDLAPDYPIGLVAAFGSSRIGNPRMREIYRERLDKNKASIHERTWHITHDDDAIPRLPPTRYFNHVGKGFLLYSGGALYSGTRPSIFYDYLEKIHEIRFLHIFFAENPFSSKGMGYPALSPHGERLPISAWEEFKWRAKLTAFFLRDTFPAYFVGIWIGGLLFALYAMLVHYGRAILKGLQRDHKVSLYRDALQERARVTSVVVTVVNSPGYGYYAGYKPGPASILLRGFTNPLAAANIPGKNFHLFGKPFLPHFQPRKPLESEDPALFAQLARYCARSYKWTRAKFAKEIANDGVTAFEVFRRRIGPLSWQPRAFIGMLISYVTLLFSFTLIVTLVFAATPIILSMWGDANDPVHYAAGSIAEWIGSNLAAALAWSLTWLSWLIIAPFTMLAQWLPSSFVSIFATSAVVVGSAVEWILGYLLEIIFPFAFWLPAGLQAWFGSHTPYWVQFFLYELRVILGLAVFFGSLFGALVLIFPWLASGRAFGIVDPGGKFVTIIFCGSTFWDNFTINACVLPHCKPLRHLGFHRAWSHIKPQIELWLAGALPKGAKVVLAGHSLGGALAEIAAYDLADRFDVDLVLAFGSSRIGGRTMRRLYKVRGKGALHRCTWHITHGDDAIPRLPPIRFFAHAGRSYLLSKTGELRLGKRPTLFEEYFHEVEARTRMSRFFFNPVPLSFKEYFHQVEARTRMSRFFFNPAPLSREEKQSYVLLDPASLQPLPVSYLQKFRTKARILAFSARDQVHAVPAFLAGVALFFYILGILAYYGLMLKRGFSGDHNVGLYRDTLQGRASNISTDAFLARILALPRGEWERMRRSLTTAPSSTIPVDKTP